MTPVALTLAALTALACWLCSSPVRLTFAAGALLATHPAPTLTLTAVVTAGLTVAAGALVYRSLRDGGWHLVTVYRPPSIPAPVPVGGVVR
ncbi:hypothetical protein [Spirillospora sp. CA-128828]|uniref:hypothetical protein n=1 Tax=Spirillospora sp. CA-128828 TaxID=3240033 RepID=UPI003D8AD2DE